MYEALNMEHAYPVNAPQIYEAIMVSKDRELPMLSGCYAHASCINKKDHFLHLDQSTFTVRFND